jgi:hypothetical protein
MAAGERVAPDNSQTRNTRRLLRHRPTSRNVREPQLRTVPPVTVLRQHPLMPTGTTFAMLTFGPATRRLDGAIRHGV